MLAVKCHGCGHELVEVPATDVGAVPCPGCGRWVRVPETTDLLELDQRGTDSNLSDTNPDTTNPYPTVGPPPAVQSATPSKELAFLGPPNEPSDLGRLGHYRVREVLGKGGMGMVFEAIDMHLQRTVALKVMRPEMGANHELRQRFLREARATAALKSDHVVTIHQVGQENDVPYLAMEYLQGKPLDRWLEAKGTPTIREALRLGIETAKGLAAAHERGLIHRDIKPSNIWIEEPNGRVKILDFGLARATQDEMRLTQTGLVMGTPEYMAPEQAEGNKVDERSDLYSLGCVIYELLTGNPPFTGPSVMSILRAVATEDAQPVRKLNPDVPADLAKVVMSLLAKCPEDRPASAAEVVEELEALSLSPATRLSDTPRPLGVRQTAVRRSNGRRLGIILAGAVLALAVGGYLVFRGRFSGEAAPPLPVGPPIRVGVLHSTTGTMALSERPVIDATLLAIDEINQAGGLLGSPVEAVVEDGQSDPAIFAAKARKLITQDQVAAVFGCWTSASRKAVRPVMENQNHLLLYPVQYEGLEQSPNIFYLGAAPNQQIIPAVKWCCTFLKKKRLFLVGSDYVFPRAANAIIRDQAASLGAEIVGEEYVLFGSTDVKEMVQKIVAAEPDVILNTINGDTNLAFFRGLRAAGITPARIPTVSFSISEEELSNFSPKDIAGDYAAWNYFQSIDRPQNQVFLGRFRKRFGPTRVASDPMEAAYVGVHLWAQAVRQVQSADPKAVRQALKNQTFDAPEGIVRIDPDTQHMEKFVRIGQVTAQSHFAVIYCSEQAIPPIPYPGTRSKADWDAFLNDIHLRWGGHWVNQARQ